MRIIDISWTLSKDMTGYKDQPGKRLTLAPTRVLSRHGVAESRLTLSSHAGTHADAPRHFLAHGTPIDRVKLDTYVGECTVYDLTRARESITAADLRALDIAKHDIVVFKTRNSYKDENAPFDPDFVFLSKDAAAYLARKKVRAVGIDYLGIETKQPGHETHTTLLRRGIGIIEGLRLKQVRPGTYLFVAAPLKIKDGDGAPCRALLIKP